MKFRFRRNSPRTMGIYLGISYAISPMCDTGWRRADAKGWDQCTFAVHLIWISMLISWRDSSKLLIAIDPVGEHQFRLAQKSIAAQAT